VGQASRDEVNFRRSLQSVVFSQNSVRLSLTYTKMLTCIEDSFSISLAVDSAVSL
jgi:hypothetical protein